MGVRSLFVLLLLACHIALTPLAQASPPDPTWIVGIYDDADFDDVVWLVTSSHGTLEMDGIPSARPLLPVAGWASALESDLAPGPSGFSSHSRAPPAS
jgi:hypothetical protein